MCCTEHNEIVCKKIKYNAIQDKGIQYNTQTHTNFYLLLTLFCPILVHPKRFLIQRQDTEMCILFAGRRWDVKECGKLLR